VICLVFHQLADIYVVLFQLLQHFLHCLFVRVSASIHHVDIRCKQITSGVRIKFPRCVITKAVINGKYSYFCGLRVSPTFPPTVYFPIFPSSLVHMQYKYTLWLYLALGSTKYWLTL
jgi:hypothetical protein